MSDKDKAMQQALEALSAELWTMLDKPVDEQYRVRYAYLLRVITALREALAQPPLPVQEQQQAEPVTWDKPSASFNEWWNGDYEDPANPFEKDSHGYWAWAGWQAALAQRPWVGLTEQERNDLENALGLFIGKPAFDAIEASLKERNT